MNSNYKSLFLLTLGFFVFCPQMAFAHPGASDSLSFSAGFCHPLSGLDHLVAMVAVGIWATQIGGKTTWLVPTVFVLLMLLGSALGIYGIIMPYTEIGILVSVIVLGLFISAKIKSPTLVSAFVVGLFAIFHGHAHGSEMPLANSGESYTIGFAITTTLLHITGIAIGFSFKKWAKEKAFRLVGASITISGIYLLVS